MASLICQSPLFEIDTKGKCLLCLNTDTENFTGHDNDSTEKYFKMFLRYLKVDLFQLTKLNSSFQPALEGSGNVNLSLSLCEKCFSVIHEFFEYFQDFERIRMQLDNCVRKVQEFIENGGRDRDLVREYRERVNPRDPKDRVNANVAENLRKDTLQKCHVKLGLSVPKVLLKEANSSKRRCRCQDTADMTTPTPIKIEQVDKGPSNDEIDSPEDHWENGDDDNSSSSDNSEPTSKRQRTNKKNKCKIVTSWKCVHCQTYYAGAPQLRTHLIKYHPKAFFGERVPDDISEQDLLSAVDKLIGKMDVTHYYGKFKEPYFQCSWCVRKNDKRAMKAHLFTLHFQNVLNATGKVTHVPGEQEEFNCDICGKSAATYRGLRVHKTIIHGKRFPFSPTITADQLEDENDDLQNNDEEAESSQKVKNNSKMERRRRLNMRNKALKTPWKCEHCGYYYSSGVALRTHLIIYHTLKFYSSRIPEGIEEQALTNAVKGLIGKMKISKYGSEVYFHCTFCKSKADKRKMYAHIFRRHFKLAIQVAAGGTFPKTEVGEESNSKFNGHQSKLKLKVKSKVTRPTKKTVLKNPTCKCTHCGSYYSGAGQLRTHLISQHTKAFFGDRIPENVSEPDLVVAVDKLIGKMKTTHYYHYKGYQEPFYQCSWCSRKFDKKTMKTHLFRLHLEVVLEATGKIKKTNAIKDHLECDICGARMNTCVGLSRHKSRIHLKHFKCGVCKSEFVKEESLKYHQLQCKPQQQTQPGSSPSPNSRGTGPSSGGQVVIERDSDCDVEIKKEPNCHFENHDDFSSLPFL